MLHLCRKNKNKITFCIIDSYESTFEQWKLFEGSSQQIAKKNQPLTSNDETISLWNEKSKLTFYIPRK